MADAAQSAGVNTQIVQKDKELYEAMSDVGMDAKDFSTYFEFMTQNQT